jgi:uncharacterized protein YutE (UPF0331/DUF86 family)
MVRPEILHKRMNKLDEYLVILHQLQRYEREEFLSNPEHYGSAERLLRLVIEALLDMGNLILADENSIGVKS